MRPNRASGGEYDPVSAKVFKPNRTQLSSGEWSVDTQNPILHLTAPILPIKGMFVREGQNQGHADSQSDLVIEMVDADNLSADMWIIHRGIRYDIKGSLGFNHMTGRGKWQVTVSNDAVRDYDRRY